MLSRQGFAMVVALALMVVVAGVLTLLATRTVVELRSSGDDAAIVATLMLARGGANMGGAVLQGPVRNALEAIVQVESDTTGPWTFGSSAFGASEPTPLSVLNDLSRGGLSVAVQLQPDIDALVCDTTLNSGGLGTIDLRIYVTGTACGEALPGDVVLPGARFVAGNPRTGTGSAEEQIFAVPYVIVSDGRVGEYLRRVVIQGEFQFTVGRGSFAKYALFTNEHVTAAGGSIWFTDNTVIDGPVHTNQYLRFHRRAWIGGEVTSAGCRTPAATSCTNDDFSRQGAEFYGQGFVPVGSMTNPSNPSYTNSYGIHEPALTAGVDWSASFVPLPANSLDQLAAAQNRGLVISNDLYSLDVWAADTLGDPLVKGADGVWGEAEYQYIRTCTSSSASSCTTYRYGDDLQLFRQNSDGTWPTSALTTPFNGVLYADGSVSRLRGPTRVPSGSSSNDDAPPAFADFAQLNLTTTGTVRITGDLKYEDPACDGAPVRNPDGTVTPATCDNLAARNVFGIFASSGDILIGNYNASSSLNAPDNVAIHGVLMSSTGVVKVEDYNRGSPRGNVNLLGGIIEDRYGAFFTFNSRTGSLSSGFGRRFTYDQRMLLGLSPPYFPTVGLDGVRSITTFTFGQREQSF